MPVECFWVEPLPLVQRSLRRYVTSTGMESRCPLMPGEHSYHNAVVVVGDVEKPVVPPGEYERAPSAHWYQEWRIGLLTVPPPVDWPETCGCGYVWPTRPIYDTVNVGAHSRLIEQVNDDRYYARSDGPGIAPAAGAERWVYHCALGLPPGAMMRTWWLEPTFVGSDGISIGVVLPQPSGMLWPIDFPPSDDANARWTRTGVPPKITASPSINHEGGGYHGFLQNGVLT